MRVAALLLLALLLSACRTLPPSPTGFDHYVALGDSLSAGFQSGGLTAGGQRHSFPAVLATLAGIPFGVPETHDPGCPPPYGAGLGLGICLRTHPFRLTESFGVPGALVADLLHTSQVNAEDLLKPLYGLILGPRETQVEAALRLRPRFITLWIGANDVLGPTTRGKPEQATPPTEFEASYAELLDALAASGANIILITVPDVTGIPGLIPGARLAQLGLGDGSCAGSPNRVALSTLRNWRVGKPVSCAVPYALTPQERAAAQATVNAYNASIHKLAAERGYGVFDADTFLRDEIFPAYDPESKHPFGPDFSLDGVHPSDTGYARIARGLAAFLNARYGTSIPVEDTPHPQLLSRKGRGEQ